MNPGADGSGRAPKGANRRAGRVAAGILLSRLLGLARESVFAHFFGNGPLADAWRAGLRIPNVVQNLLGEGSLSASFIPVHVRLLEQGREREAGRVAGAVLGLLVLAAGGLAALGVWAAPMLAAVITPGFAGDERAEILTGLLRILFPMTAVLAVSAWALGVLNSHRRFFVAYVAPGLWNAAIITAVVAAAARGLAGVDLLEAMAWGALAGGGAQLLFQIGFAIPYLKHLAPSLGRGVAEVREVLRNLGPVVAARGAVNLGALLDVLLASLLAQAAVAMTGYAQTLYLVPISLFGMSIAAAELPELARDSVDGIEAVRKRAEGAARAVLFWLVPCAVGYAFFGDEVAALYRILPGGAFGAGDAAAVGIVLGFYAFGMPASGASRVLASAFHALGDTRTPARIAMIRIGASALVGAAIMFPLDLWRVGGLGMGAAGLALGATAGAWLEFRLLRRALAGRLPGLNVGGRTVRRCVWAALAAAALGLGAEIAVGSLAPDLHPLLRAGAAVVPFAAGYLALVRRLGVPVPGWRRTR